MGNNAADFAGLFRNGDKPFRRYALKTVDGRLKLVRNELDRMFDLALRDVSGCEIERDEKD